jgi:serine/threonine kinase PknH
MPGTVETSPGTVAISPDTAAMSPAAAPPSAPQSSPPSSSAPVPPAAYPSTGPSSGPMPAAAQTGQPWAPSSGPVPTPGHPAHAPHYQTGGSWGGPPPSMPVPQQFSGSVPWNQGPPVKPKRNPWPIIAAVALVFVVVVSGVGIWFATRPDPAPPPPDPIPPERLSALLLNPVDMNSVMGSSSMEPGKPILSMDSSTVTLSAPGCQGALYTTQDPVYAGSGYTGISGLVSSEPGDNYDHWVNQAVVLFPSADKAKSFMETSADKWKNCTGKTVSVTNKSKNKTYRWTLAQITGSPPKVSMMETQEGADGWECQRSLGVANNVVIDINACGYHLTNQGDQIIDKITAKINSE